MADGLYEIHSSPDLDRPVLVVAMEGWIDAGLGAAGAIAGLVRSIDSVVVASFDTDVLLDQRARRPMIRIVDGVHSDLLWPQIELRSGRDANGSQLLTLTGPEPDHLWKAFSSAVGELGTQFGVRMMVGLGAFPAPIPHTRPARLAATASSEELAHRVGFVPGTLDVPAGAEAAVESEFAGMGIPAVGLWARVPHYAAAMPYPPASLLLLEGLRDVAGIEIDTTDLVTATAATHKHLDDLVANSEEHQALVRQLEAQFDAELEDPMQMASGEELAAEFERFLRGESP